MVTERKATHRGHTSFGACRAVRRVERPHRRPSRKPVTTEGGRVFFSGRRAQQVARPGAADWLGAAAMLLAAATWGMLASLLAS